MNKYDLRSCGDERLATKSFYEDLVIDTPEAAERFAAMIEENRPYVSKGHKLVMATPEFIRSLADGIDIKEP